MDQVVHPFSIAFYDGTLYWSDWGFSGVFYASLSTQGMAMFDVVDLVALQSDNDPTAVKVVAFDLQPISEFIL